MKKTEKKSVKIVAKARKKKESACETMPRYVTQTRLAEILDVSDMAVSKIAASNDFKRNANGELDLMDVLYHMAKRRMTTDADEYQAQRVRKIRAEAEMAEHELAISKRQVVPLKEAEDFIKSKLAPIAVEIRTLPARLGVLCVGLDDAREAEQIITKEVDKCLSKIRES